MSLDNGCAQPRCEISLCTSEVSMSDVSCHHRHAFCVCRRACPTKQCSTKSMSTVQVHANRYKSSLWIKITMQAWMGCSHRYRAMSRNGVTGILDWHECNLCVCGWYALRPCCPGFRNCAHVLTPHQLPSFHASCTVHLILRRAVSK